MWEQISENSWRLVKGYGEWRISRYTFNSYYECEPYYVGYDYAGTGGVRGKRITGECPTFDMCDLAIERHLQEENKKEFP